MSWFFSRKDAKSIVNDYFASDRFAAVMAEAIQPLILQNLRETPDNCRISEHAFILKIAVALYDASQCKMPWLWAKEQASDIYRQFRKDCPDAQFADKEYDWTGSGAKSLAEEYSIQYWD